MKWYYVVAVLLGLGWLSRRSTSTPGLGVDDRPTPPPPPPPPVSDTEKMRVFLVIQKSGDPVGDPAKIHPADQTLYPGFYLNEYGGYYNPETGESFPPGTSPPAVGLNGYQKGAPYPTYDVSKPTVTGAPPLSAGYVVY